MAPQNKTDSIEKTTSTKEESKSLWDTTANTLIKNRDGKFPDGSIMPLTQEMNMTIDGEKNIKMKKKAHNHDKKESIKLIKLNTTSLKNSNQQQSLASVPSKQEKVDSSSATDFIKQSSKPVQQTKKVPAGSSYKPPYIPVKPSKKSDEFINWVNDN